MLILENKIPPLFVALVFCILMWWISSLSAPIELSFIFRIVLSSVIIMTGLFFCAAGIICFKRANTTVNPLQPEAASSLVSSGIYRFSRNPMYVGFALFLVSFSIYLSSPHSILGVAGFILYMNKFQIEPEERALEEIFGSAFSHYKSNVRRWL